MPTKVCVFKAMIFPIVMYRWESWIIKAKHWRIDAFELWGWGRLLRVPWTARRSNQSILKEINPEYSLEGLMAEAEAPIFWPPEVNSQLIGKDPDVGKEWRQEEKGTIEDEMVGWPHQLNGLEFEQTPGDSEGQGSLVCCSPWGHKELDTTEWLNNSHHNLGIWCFLMSWPITRSPKALSPAAIHCLPAFTFPTPTFKELFLCAAP